MNKSNINLKMMCLTGVMAALYVGFELLTEPMSTALGGDMKILAFSGLTVMIVSIFGGPVWGAATGFIGEFLTQLLLWGFAPTTFLWVLPAVIRGLVMGWLFNAFKKSMAPGVLILETCITALVVTLSNTGVMLIDQMLYGYYNSYYAIVVAIPKRAITGVVTAVIFSLMLPTIVNALKGVLKKR